MARIDDSHQPFKRKRSIGPDPKRHPKVSQVKEWECAAKKPTSTHYVTVCRWIGEGTRKPTVNKMSKAKKRAYNKLYRPFAAKKRTTGGKLPSYRCRRTRSASCK